ncbi:MAG: hypothetical protein ABUT20_35290 [Bacteroidota bacterium]
MKKILIVMLIVLVTQVNVSCKKDSTDVPIGTLKASIDGAVTNFNVSAKASNLSVQGGQGIKIFGYKKDPTLSGTSFQIVIASPASISSGTYVENTNDNPLVQVNYFYDFFFGAGFSYSNYHSSTAPMTINITEKNSGSIKGTFSGELKGNDLNGNPIVSKITNGVFNVSF